MPKKKTARAEHGTAGEPVRLKPLLGIEPRVYVAVLYGFGLAAFLFAILIMPGLLHPGAMVRFDSRPDGAAVMVDGRYLGATPLESFVAAGEREIRISRPFFEDASRRIRVPGRIVGSLFFNIRMNVKEALRPRDMAGLLEETARDFSALAMGPAPTELFTPPPVLSAAANGLAADLAPQSVIAGRLFLESQLPNLVSAPLVEDFVRAVVLNEAGSPLTSAGILRAVSYLIQLEKKYPNLLPLVVGLLPTERTERLAASAHFRARQAGLAESLRVDPLVQDREIGEARARAPGAPIVIGGLRFRQVPGGVFHQGLRPHGPDTGFDIPHRAEVAPFFLKESEVSEALFHEFITANPEWERFNKDELVRAGLVDEFYLANWPAEGPPATPDLPVRHVSHAAAEAFCEWLSRRNPGYVFFLPSESEWEWAALLDGSPGDRRSTALPPPAASLPAGSIGLRGMSGGVWEWCSGWYRPADALFPSLSARSPHPAAERPVRGGSWLVAADPQTRASQPPEWCTPFLGFRPAARVRGSAAAVQR